MLKNISDKITYISEHVTNKSTAFINWLSNLHPDHIFWMSYQSPIIKMYTSIHVYLQAQPILALNHDELLQEIITQKKHLLVQIKLISSMPKALNVLLSK